MTENTSTAVTTLSQKVQSFNSTLNKYEQTVASLLGEKYGMSAKEFLVSIMNAIKKTPALLECDSKSLFGAILLSAELRLKPNTPEGFAYIIPYGKSAQFQLGYKGLIEIAYRSNRVKSIIAVPVYENEYYREFEDNTFKHVKFTGMDLNILELCNYRKKYLHELGGSEAEIEIDNTAYKKRLEEKGKGGVVLAYAVVFMEGLEQPIWTSVTGDTLKQIEKISKAAGSASSPYKNGTDVHNTMQFKAAVKKVFKFLPKTEQTELAKAIEIDDRAMAGAIPFMDDEGNVQIIDITEQSKQETSDKIKAATGKSEANLTELK